MSPYAAPMARRHPLNVIGPFYAEDGGCITCGAPEHEAPTLIASIDEPAGHCYFKRQPETLEEVEQAIRAIEVSCCGALRYDGDDERIRARVGEALRVDESPSEPLRRTSSRFTLTDGAMLLLGAVGVAVILWGILAR